MSGPEPDSGQAGSAAPGGVTGVTVLKVFSRKNKRPPLGPSSVAKQKEVQILLTDVKDPRKQSIWSELFKAPGTWTPRPAAATPGLPSISPGTASRRPERGSWVGRTLRYGRSRVSLPGARGLQPGSSHGAALMSPLQDSPGSNFWSPESDIEEEEEGEEDDMDTEEGLILETLHSPDGGKTPPKVKRQRRQRVEVVASEPTPEHTAYISEMRAYFEEVDQEELQEESPPPTCRKFEAPLRTPGQGLKGTTPTPLQARQKPSTEGHGSVGPAPTLAGLSSTFSPPIPTSRAQQLPTPLHTELWSGDSGRHRSGLQRTVLRRTSVLVPASVVQASASATPVPDRGAMPGVMLRFTPMYSLQGRTPATATPPLFSADRTLMMPPPGLQSRGSARNSGALFRKEQAIDAADEPAAPGLRETTPTGLLLGTPAALQDDPTAEEKMGTEGRGREAASTLVSQTDASPAADDIEEELGPVVAADVPPVQQLLKFCGQSDAELLPGMEEMLSQFCDPELGFVKVGEGMLGEAYRCGDTVFKVMPLEGDMLVNGEPQKKADEILAEAKIAHTLSMLRASEGVDGTETDNSTCGFVELRGVGVSRGPYAPALRTEWHRWDEEHRSENEAVDCFGVDQLFILFAFAEGGVDLEHFGLESFDEGVSMLHQVTTTLAVAEEACQFEHRDLHWGNLLLRRSGSERTSYKLNGTDLDVSASGIEVVLIDYTLSRLITSEGDLAFCDLEADPELFQGPKGDCQAETYRRMRKAVRNNWSTYQPITNSLWLHYLADNLLGPKQQQLGASPGEMRLLRGFRKRALAASCAADLLQDELFAGRVLDTADV